MTEKRKRFGVLQETGGFGGLAANAGIGILQCGFEDPGGDGFGGRLHGHGTKGRGTDCRGGVPQGLLVRLKGGVFLQDEAGFRGRKFGLAGEEVKMHAFLPEIGAVRDLAQTGLHRFLGLLDFSLFHEPVSLPGNPLFRSRAGGKDQGEEQGGESRAHGCEIKMKTRI